jgi:hypothetical protein
MMIKIMLYVFVFCTIVFGIRTQYLKFRYYKEGLKINPVKWVSFNQLRKAAKDPNNSSFLDQINYIRKIHTLNIVFFCLAILLGLLNSNNS